MEHLALCPNFKELTLTGNPCTDWPDYKDYVIAKIPQIKRIDSVDITKSMKIIAEQRLEELEKVLAEKAEEVTFKKANEPVNLNGYNPESRMKDYYDDLERKQQEELNKPKNPFEVPDEFKNKRTEPPSVYHENGDIRQCNEGRYNFKITEDDDNDRILVELFLPKYLTTDLLDADVNPLYIRFNIKDKITQLKLPEEIEVDKSKVQRSQTSGVLLVICPTVRKRERNTKEYKTEREEYKKKKKLAQLEKEMQEKSYIKYLEEEKQEELTESHSKGDQKIKPGESDKRIEEEPYEPDFDLDELPELE
jgi:protein TilB